MSRNVKVKIYKTTILPVVLYGSETWSLTLREEHRLGMFENRVLRRRFGPKRDEVTGEWRKLHSGELHNLYSFLYIIRRIKSRRMKWARRVARVEQKRDVYKILVGELKGKSHSEGRGVYGRLGSIWTLERLAGMVWSGFIWLRIGTGGGLFEHGDELSDSGATELVGRQRAVFKIWNL
jgi:hypothetical protein